MKSGYRFFLTLSIAGLFFAGCESKAGTGAIVGGGLGAGTGAIIAGGHGALIGGAVGIVGGAIVGHLLDDAEKDNIKKQNPSTMRRVDNNQQLTVDDIIVLHNAGLTDEKIIELIKHSNSKFSLSTRSVQKLEKAGVSPRLIDFMLSQR